MHSTYVKLLKECTCKYAYISHLLRISIFLFPSLFLVSTNLYSNEFCNHENTPINEATTHIGCTYQGGSFLSSFVGGST